MKQGTIEPMIVFGQGQCTECGGQLTVVDMETTFLRLDKNGSPVTEDTMIKCEAVCMNCGKRYPMLRSGLDYFRDNEYSRLRRWYLAEQTNAKRKEELDKLIPSEDNPFCINQKGQP